jgi:hypothetical protein
MIDVLTALGVFAVAMLLFQALAYLHVRLGVDRTRRAWAAASFAVGLWYTANMGDPNPFSVTATFAFTVLIPLALLAWRHW